MKKIMIINFLIVLYLEFMFQLILINTYTIDSVISRIIYSIFISLLITLIISLFKNKIRNIISYVIYILLSFWFSLDAIFYLSLKSFFTLSLFKLTDQAVGFIGETFLFIFKYFFIIIIFFLPVTLYICFRKKIKYNIKNYDYIILILLIIISYIGYNGYFFKNKDNLISNYNLYHKIDNINLSTERLGVLPSIHTTLFKVKDNYFNNSNKDIEVSSSNNNVLNITYDDKINKDIKSYIDNNSGTNKNNYTGYFKDKNIIFVTAESFSDIAVDKDLTPTLYKLTHNGFVFNNYYNPYYLSTVAGEFQVLTSLYPNTSTLDNWKEGTNSFPYGVGNMFKQNGYNTYAYHAHDGSFQNRYLYMQSIGFNNFKACNMGLDINCNIWPESDIEMINSTYKDYIDSDKPFLAYYMTVSGHMNYDFKTNDIAIKNKSLVDNLPYSSSVKAYLASQIELDRALELLLNVLEENNKLDDTVIILTADHYPYQLKLNEINELSTYKRDDLFEVNHSNLVIYNNKMETKYIDKVGMSVDIIPTLYNLLGFNYDSRLYIGNDILSDSEGIAIFGNLSWISDKGKYNSLTGDSSLSNEEINKINTEVLNKISFSKNMINYDGYKYIKVEE